MYALCSLKIFFRKHDPGMKRLKVLHEIKKAVHPDNIPAVEDKMTTDHTQITGENKYYRLSSLAISCPAAKMAEVLCLHFVAW